MKQANHGVNTSIIASSANTSNYYIVRIRVTYGGKRVDLRPGITIEIKDQWQGNRVKRGCKVLGVSYNEINRRLTRYEGWVHDYFLTCEEHHLEPSLAELRLWFNTEVSKKDDSKGLSDIPRLVKAKKTFFELYKNFLEYMKERHKDSLCKEDAILPYLQLEKRLLEFDNNLSLEIHIFCNNSVVMVFKIFLLP